MDDRSYGDRELKKPRHSAPWMYPAAIAVLMVVLIVGLVVLMIFKPTPFLLHFISAGRG